eukprot:CAMPEP_0174329570 /NCGR_PEP_ID=MMETSP0810-20121108/15961_1 /TAXON_ID=73025 ORGANISM="Eutreptiella gymnastica-like, Strain CCMP1594" /NCGR_SAMPLE_ID=MMETSP0810 /ASSEMBLY_ACC=CAM_ASM_000659 /LENGTH=74 /DNA_ID=CAMNT_0015444173 /DNA_START=35 /DNA_END=256 /DNA_ORIENTATION=+
MTTVRVGRQTVYHCRGSCILPKHRVRSADTRSARALLRTQAPGGTHPPSGPRPGAGAAAADHERQPPTANRQPP